MFTSFFSARVRRTPDLGFHLLLSRNPPLAKRERGNAKGDGVSNPPFAWFSDSVRRRAVVARVRKPVFWEEKKTPPALRVGLDALLLPNTSKLERWDATAQSPTSIGTGCPHTPRSQAALRRGRRVLGRGLANGDLQRP